MKWWLPLVYLLLLLAAYLLGRNTAPRPVSQIVTDTVYVEKIIQPDTTSSERPPPVQVRIERPARPVKTDTLKIRAPVGVRWYGLVAPRPLHLDRGRAVLTYWHFPSGTWRQEVYRIPPRQRVLSAYMVLARHWGRPANTWAAGVGIEVQKGRVALAVEATNLGLTLRARIRVW